MMANALGFEALSLNDARCVLVSTSLQRAHLSGVPGLHLAAGSYTRYTAGILYGFVYAGNNACSLSGQMKLPSADDAPGSGCNKSDLLVYSRHQGFAGRAFIHYVANGTDKRSYLS
jgi:hypothetical protein